MRMWVCFSVGKLPTDQIIKDGEGIEIATLGCTPPLPLCNHCWTEFELEDGTVEGVEAVLPRVRTFDPTEKHTQIVRRYLVSATDEQITTAYRTAKRFVGHLYDYWGIVLVAWHIVCRNFTLALFRRSHHLAVYCAELVVIILRAAAIAFLGVLAPDNATPSNVEAETVNLKWALDPYKVA